VIGFADGVEALLWLTGPLGQWPGLILLDITMPRMDGYEVTRYLKTRPHVGERAIVMLTRYDGTVDRLKSRLVGAADHLCKPFQTQQLLRVVTSHLGVPQTKDIG
jgi:twitching motility two-component system response regulator PilG